MTPEPLVSAGEVERLLFGTPPVDAGGLEARAVELVSRSLGRDAERSVLELVIRCMDLTSLEGTETDGEIAALCDRAMRPDPHDASAPPVAAVCIYPRSVPVAVARLRESDVAVASVAGGFPSGLGPLRERLEEIRAVADAGADEVDIVLNRSLFLGGRYADAFEELARAREAAGDACLKVILETGELGSFDRIHRAGVLAMAAGADFVKTSTGKVRVGATAPAALCMMEAVRDFQAETGRRVGIKVAGGVRETSQAIGYLVLLQETLGEAWLTPDRFRIGASSLLADVLMRRQE